jgi:hypothetical protein
MAFPQERNQEATVYVGDLDPQVTDAILWELFLQAGPVGMFSSPAGILGSFPFLFFYKMIVFFFFCITSINVCQ